jgi:hypothetical protein
MDGYYNTTSMLPISLYLFMLRIPFFFVSTIPHQAPRSHKYRLRRIGHKVSFIQIVSTGVSSFVFSGTLHRTLSSLLNKYLY